MSKDLEASGAAETEKPRKPKDSPDKKPSKKRKRVERDASPEPPAQAPVKKARVETDAEDSDSSMPMVTAPTSPASPSALSVDASTPGRSRARHLAENTNSAIPGTGTDVADEVEPSTNSVDSPFFTQTTSFYLALSPIAQSSPLEGLCAEHFSPLILTYCPPLNGVILSYSNPRFSKEQLGHADEGDAVLSHAVDEYGVTYVWVTADFVVLKPQKDTWIKGYVSVQSDNHIGLVCWNLFNASIERARLPKGWRWVAGAREKSKGGKYGEGGPRKAEGGGYWLDASGNPVEGPMRFRVCDFDNSTAFGKDKNFITIEGSLLSAEDEVGGEGEEDGRQVQAAQERREKVRLASEAREESKQREREDVESSSSESLPEIKRRADEEDSSAEEEEPAEEEEEELENKGVSLNESESEKDDESLKDDQSLDEEEPEKESQPVKEIESDKELESDKEPKSEQEVASDEQGGSDEDMNSDPGIVSDEEAASDKESEPEEDELEKEDESSESS